MDWANNTTEVLYFLVPGFIAAAVYYGLTSAPKPSTFERVVQALIFTVIIQGLGKIGNMTGWMEAETWKVAAPSVSVAIAIIIGITVVLLVNRDLPHKWLRRCGITMENAYPTDWFRVFTNNPGCFVVLYLRDGQRLYGWPKQWPGSEHDRLFVIELPEWITDDGKRIEAGRAVVVQAEDVVMVELVNMTAEPAAQEEKHEHPA